MSRPLRLEFPDAVYHVISRGNDRAAVFLDDDDRRTFLRLLDRVGGRLRWRLLAYCLMSNHYHLVLQTPEPTLARGMRDLNGTYAQLFNRGHERVGHVFQGRYRSVLVERGGHLLEVMRYVALNPVRAGLCTRPDDWPWSSHRALVGRDSSPPALDCSAALATFGAPLANARSAYDTFVLACVGLPSAVEDQARCASAGVAGSREFRASIMEQAEGVSPEVPRPLRRTRELAQVLAESGTRDEAIFAAYSTGDYSLAAIGRYFGLHYSTVSKICRRSPDPLGRRARQALSPAVAADRQFKT